jgi:hypothetical protein
VSFSNLFSRTFLNKKKPHSRVWAYASQLEKKFTMSEDIDAHVLRKYQVQQKLGKGVSSFHFLMASQHSKFFLFFQNLQAYGIVWKAIDKKTQQTVALKKIFDAFQNATDAQRTFREIMFLNRLDNHENIVKLLNVLKAENDRDIYLVFEYMGQWISKRKKTQYSHLLSLLML